VVAVPFFALHTTPARDSVSTGVNTVNYPQITGVVMKRFLMGWIFLTFCSSAFSGNVLNAKIQILMIDKTLGDMVFIQASAPHPAGSACHTSTRWAFALPLVDPIDDKIYSALLAAYTERRTVNLIGSDVCDLRPDIETLIRVEAIQF
jgi:hypothetical protein